MTEKLKRSEEKIFCNHNSRDNELCCRCDSRTSNTNMVNLNSLKIIVRMIDDKPYYEVLCRNVGKNGYHNVYSLYSLRAVLEFIDGYFGEVESDNCTNANRIRNMSDEELAEYLPCCENRYEVDYDNYDHCPNCRHKLDWEDEDE